MALTRSIESAEPARRPLARPPAWELAALAGLLALALLLRFNRYTQAPALTDNADELQFAWAGLNLILHGDAYTWAEYPGYLSRTPYHAFGTSFSLVHHWMDHPPLFSLVMGGWTWLLGDRSMTQVDAAQVRIPPVLFSAATVGLSFLFGRRLLGALPALLGALLLATTPGAVLLGREAEPESLQAVLLLVALLVTLRVAEGGGGRVAPSVLLLCAAAAPLMKVSGVALAGICAVILAAEGRWRLAGGVAAAGAAGLLAFVAYGALIDWGLFVRIWHVQTGNRVGVMSGFDFIAAMAGVNRRLRDGWWLLGWIGVGGLALSRLRRRELFLAWPAIGYALAMVALAGERQVEQYGWYRVIVYPEVYLAAGWLTWEAVSRRSLSLLALVLALGGAGATNWWLGGPGAAWVPGPLLLGVLLAAVLGPAVLAAWRRGRADLRLAAEVAATAALAVLLLGNAVESLWLDRIFARM